MFCGDFCELVWGFFLVDELYVGMVFSFGLYVVYLFVSFIVWL